MDGAPCKNCKDRYVGCHSKCDKYIKFKKDLRKTKYKEKIDKKIEDDIWYTINEVRKGRR